MPSGRKPNLQKRRQVQHLRRQGLSLSEIARRFGVSKQAVWSLLHYRPRLTQARTVPCTGCGAKIVSPGVLRRDAASALCPVCLASRPDVPFGQRLLALRLSAGLTQADLSRRAAVAPGAVRAYEVGQRRPQARTLVRLVRVLGNGLTNGRLRAGVATG